MTSRRNQGSQATRTGRVLEEHVKSIFSSYGFTVIPYADYLNLPKPIEGNYLVLNAPYTSIYNHQGKTEFLAVSSERDLTIRIECKWQQVSGSVDEKFPYLFENCLIMPEDTIFILLDGEGYKPEARQWLANEAKNCKKKDIRVFNMTGFTTWANNNL